MLSTSNRNRGGDRNVVVTDHGCNRRHHLRATVFEVSIIFIAMSGNVREYDISRGNASELTKCQLGVSGKNLVTENCLLLTSLLGAIRTPMFRRQFTVAGGWTCGARFKDSADFGAKLRFSRMFDSRYGAFWRCLRVLQ